jgi:hypothetical protein
MMIRAGYIADGRGDPVISKLDGSHAKSFHLPDGLQFGVRSRRTSIGSIASSVSAPERNWELGSARHLRRPNGCRETPDSLRVAEAYGHVRVRERWPAELPGRVLLARRQ